MLILSRKVGQELCIANEIVVAIKRIKGDRVTIGISAPAIVKVLRGELKLHEPLVTHAK